MRAALRTTPDLSAFPPRATNASTKITTWVTVLVFLGHFPVPTLVPILFESCSLVEHHIDIKNADLFVCDFSIDIVFLLLINLQSDAYNWASITFQNIDHVIEADPTISVLGLLKQILDLLVLGLAENAPLLVEQLLEISPTSSSHLLICYTNQI